MPNSPHINKAYLDIVQNLELAPFDKLFHQLNIAPKELLTRDFISTEEAIILIKNFKAYSYTPNFAAIFGAHLGAASHGSVGYATLSAPSVGKALSTFIKWFHVRAEVYSATITENDEDFEIEITDTTNDNDFKTFFFEALMRALEVIATYILGQSQATKTTICFETLAQDRQALMIEEYSSKLLFGERKNKLKIPKDTWFTASPLYDKGSYELNLVKCQQIMEERELGGSLELKVRIFIRKQFDEAIRTNSLLFPPNLSQVSNIINMSERTLIRRLQESDTSFRAILEDERKSYACKLLKEMKYSVYDIAEILGYKESTNFCRAFKTWFKKTPSQYRKSAC